MAVTTDRRQGVNSSNAVKTPCTAATTGNITLSALQTIDGIAVAAGQRVLVKNQTSSVDNGIYVADTGTWTRDLDFDGLYDVKQGTVVYVTSGSTNQGFWYVTTADPITPGTTAMAFALAFSTSGTPLSIAQFQNQYSVYVATVGGTVDVITLTPTTAITAYTAGQRFAFLSAGYNTIAPTINISGQGAQNITKFGNTPLVANDMPVAGVMVAIEYDGTQFQLTDFLSTGTSGHVLPYLDGNNTTSGNEIHTGSEDFRGALKMNTVAAKDGQVPQAVAGAATMGWWVPRGYLGGLGLSNDGGTPLTVLDIAAGEATDSTNTYIMKLAAFTKNMNAIFAAGTGNGGLFQAGPLGASTWYHAFLIRKTADGSIDVYADTSVTAVNIPAGYAAFRRIGSFKTDGANHILPFTQDGDRFSWTSPVQDVAAGNPGVAAVTKTLASVPLGLRVGAWLSAGLTSSTSSGNEIIVLYVSDLSTTDLAAFGATADTASTGAAGGNISMQTECVKYTNTSQQVRIRLNISEANFVVYLITLGWIDRRGQDA